MTGLWVGLGTMVAATMVGMFWRRNQGRVQRRGKQTAIDPVAEDPMARLPEAVRCRLDRAAAVTLLLLTAPICGRCPQARAVLRDVVATTPEVRLVELDLAANPELAADLGVRSMPTTLAISRTGHELFRVTGVPRRGQLLGAVQPHLMNSAGPRLAVPRTDGVG